MRTVIALVQHATAFGIEHAAVSSRRQPARNDVVKTVSPMRDLRFRLGYHGRRFALALLERPQPAATVFLGSEYGGWHILPRGLGPASIIYSAGLGSDSTFDLAVIERFGCDVHSFDPTPSGLIEGARASAVEPRFKFHPSGLWDSDGAVEFFEPANPAHDSFSIPNLPGTAKSIRCAVKRVPTLMQELGHDHIDLLKMDIEGAEYAVLADVLASKVRVEQLCVEFDQPAPLRRTITMLNILREQGFTTIARHRWDYTLGRMT